MMTLRIGPGCGKSAYHPSGGLAAPILPRFENLPATTRACPRCQRDLTGYRFITNDGLPITTYHCAMHGDVIPVHGVITHDE